MEIYVTVGCDETEISPVLVAVIERVPVAAAEADGHPDEVRVTELDAESVFAPLLVTEADGERVDSAFVDVLDIEKEGEEEGEAVEVGLDDVVGDGVDV